MGIDITNETGTDAGWTPAKRKTPARSARRTPAPVTAAKGAPDHYSETISSEKDKVTQFMGWFSIALGAAELFAPRGVARAIGIDEEAHTTLLRIYGLREIAAGLGILARPKPTYWMWNRVLGDSIDLASLGKAMQNPENDKARLTAATVAVIGATAVDVICSVKLTRDQTRHATGHDTGSYEIPQPAEGLSRLSAIITVNKPVEEVYFFWKDPRNLPRFMNSLESVHPITDRLSHWKIKAPAGMSVEFDAEIVTDNPNEMIEWRSVDASDVENTGTVRFRSAAGNRGTEVELEAEFKPKGGPLGARVARAMSMVPKTNLMNDLRRFKQLIEVGEVVKSDATAVAGMHPARPPKSSELEARQ
jgi:uncharacterized membrane protein